MIDEKTPHLKLPLPHADNLLEDDVSRLRESLTVLDTQAQLMDERLAEAAETAAWNGVSEKPEAFPPMVHAMSHEPGGNDALTRFSGLLTEKVQNLGVISGTVTINLASGHYVVATVGGAVTINVSGAEPGVCTAVMLELDNAGSAAVTWGMTPIWAGGVAPSLTASGKDYVGLSFRGEGRAGVLVTSDAK